MGSTQFGKFQASCHSAAGQSISVNIVFRTFVEIRLYLSAMYVAEPLTSTSPAKPNNSSLYLTINHLADFMVVVFFVVFLLAEDGI
jgi:hypothetical protein